jgi:hypothetical protein
MAISTIRLTIAPPLPQGKRVFVRADLNVPLDKATLAITDDTRIRVSACRCAPRAQLLLPAGPDPDATPGASSAGGRPHHQVPDGQR